MLIYLKPLIKLMLEHPDERISSIITQDVFLYIHFYLEVDTLYFEKLQNNSSTVLSRYLLYSPLKTIGKINIEKSVDFCLNEIFFNAEELRPLFRKIDKSIYFNIENFEFESRACGKIQGNIYRKLDEPMSYDLRLNFIMDRKPYYSINAAVVSLLYQINKYIELLKSPVSTDLLMEIIALVKELSSISTTVSTENLYAIENLSQQINLISMIYE